MYKYSRMFFLSVYLSMSGRTGVDIVMQAVEDNRRKLAHRPDMRFEQMDIVAQVPPPVDLIFTRETLQHLTQGDALKALLNFNKSGAKYDDCLVIVCVVTRIVVRVVAAVRRWGGVIGALCACSVRPSLLPRRPSHASDTARFVFLHP